MKYSFQEFRIQDLALNRVAAVAQFKHLGFEISMSQIFDSPSKVAVFADEGQGVCVHECDTVSEAIAWVQAQDNGRRMQEAAKR